MSQGLRFFLRLLRALVFLILLWTFVFSLGHEPKCDCFISLCVAYPFQEEPHSFNPLEQGL